MLRKMLSVMLAVSLAASPLAAAAPTAVAFAKEETAAGTVIDLTDFGADPLGIMDSEPAIMAAIEAVKKVDGPVTLSFPKGEYHFYPDKAYERELYISNTVGTDQSHKMKKIGFLFENMKDVTVDGNGSRFIFHGKMTSLTTIGCTNVKFQNFAVDFAVPTVIDITVESIEGNSATVYVPECYDYDVNGTTVTWKSDKSPYTGETYWTTTNGMNYTQMYDLQSGKTIRTGNLLFTDSLTSVEKLEGHRLKFHFSSSNSSLKEGYCYQMRPTVRDHAGMFFWKSKNIVLQGVDVQFLHGFGIVGQNTENVSLLDVDFETPEGSGRTTVSYADFVQMSGCKGQIHVKGCTFSNPHDDPINVHGTFMEVVERIASNKFKVRYRHGETAGFPNFFKGDKIEFVNKNSLVSVAGSEATVTDVQGPTGDAGVEQSGTNSLTDIIITLDKNMPEDIVPYTSQLSNGETSDYVVENITYTPSVLIEDNLFKNTPTRGILVTTRQKVEIRNNVFDGMGMAAIYISNDANNWRESGATKDVVIEGNVFYRSGMGTQEQAVIFVDPTNSSVSTEQTVHGNIAIRDNVFFMVDNKLLSAKSVKNVEFTDNKIYRYDPQTHVTLTAPEDSVETGNQIQLSSSVTGAALNDELYEFKGCNTVKIDGNLYDGGLRLGASLQNGMSNSNIAVGSNDELKVGSSATTNTQGEIIYESNDGSVIQVSEDGKTATAVKAGTAKVRACALVGGRKFVSDWKEITVTGSGSSSENAGGANFPPAAEAGLASVSFVGVSGLKSLDFNSDTVSYLTTAETAENILSGTFEAKDENAKVEVSLNDRVCAEPEGATAEITDVKLASGSNVIEVNVTAEDGLTTKTYRFVVIRYGDTDGDLKGISLNGKELPGFDKDTDTYSYTMAAGTDSVKVVANTDSEHAEVAIGSSANVIDGKEATLDLEKGVNTVYVRVRPETKTETKLYKIYVIVSADTDGDLQSMEAEGPATLNERFESGRQIYTGIATSKEISLKLKAAESKAKIEVSVDGKNCGSGTGEATADLPITEGQNVALVRVTAPDGKTQKSYVLQLEGIREMPLSELAWDESQSSIGWKDPGVTAMRNKSINRNTLTLRNADGTDRTFESGVGSHADCQLVYHIAGMGFQKFSTYVGVDREVGNAGSVNFKVYVDNRTEPAYESGELTSESAMGFSGEISVEGASTLKLVGDKGSNNSSDHADFADAKFITDVSEAESPKKEVRLVQYQADNEKEGTVQAKVGTTSSADGVALVSEGESLVLTASAKRGYRFVGWYAGGLKVSDQASMTVKNVTANAVYTAKYEPFVDVELEAAEKEVNSLLAAEKSMKDKGQGDYTSETWKAYVDAYNKLQSAMNSGTVDAGTLRSLLEALKAAKSGLKKKEVYFIPENFLTAGMIHNVGNLDYKILDMKKRTVSLVGVRQKNSLKRLNVPSTVTLTGIMPGSYTSSSIKFTVTNIGDKAFSKCKKLTGVVIGASVTSVGKQAFAGCSKLKKIKVKSKVLKKIGKKALKGIHKKAVITVPKKQKAKYKKLFKKKGQAATVKIR